MKIALLIVALTASPAAAQMTQCQRAGNMVYCTTYSNPLNTAPVPSVGWQAIQQMQSQPNPGATFMNAYNAARERRMQCMAYAQAIGMDGSGC